MNLNANERLAILCSLLPPRGTIDRMRITADIRKLVELTEDEEALIEYRVIEDEAGGSTLRWNRSVAGEIIRDLNFSPSAVSLMKDRIRELDSKGELTVFDLSVIDKIHGE